MKKEKEEISFYEYIEKKAMPIWKGIARKIHKDVPEVEEDELLQQAKIAVLEKIRPNYYITVGVKEMGHMKNKKLSDKYHLSHEQVEVLDEITSEEEPMATAKEVLFLKELEKRLTKVELQVYKTFLVENSLGGVAGRLKKHRSVVYKTWERIIKKGKELRKKLL